MSIFRNNKWFWLVLACLTFWLVVWMKVTGTVRARGYEMTKEEIEEEEYYDSLELLAFCVEAEAGNQSLEGKRMVADVILNRVDDPDWPDTITGVITDSYEFSSYWNGAMDRILEPSEETFLAVQMELEDRSYPGLYYFTANGYSRYGTPWKKVGDHYFSTK